MELIQHRVNTLAELQALPPQRGIEIDLRYDGKRIVLEHDPYKGGEDFEPFVCQIGKRLTVLNVKNEGIELDVRALCQRHDVTNYFFLDISFPAMVKLWGAGESKIAARFSEHEPLEQVLALKEKIDWVWVDCFSNLPLTAENYARLKMHFKLCLVSPELQKQGADAITVYRKQLGALKAHMDAVCTDFPGLWEK